MDTPGIVVTPLPLFAKDDLNGFSKSQLAQPSLLPRLTDPLLETHTRHPKPSLGC